MKRLIFFALILALIVPGLAQQEERVQLADLLRPRVTSYALVLNQNLRTTDSPTFAGLTLSGGTASTLAYLNSSKKFTSLANGSGYLLNDGSGGLSWGAVSLSGLVKDDGTVPLTADWNVGAFDLTCVDMNATNFKLSGTGTLTSTAGNATFTTSLTAATGNEAAFTFNYTTNKATSGNDTGLKIVQTDTASPGTSYLTEWYTGATQVGYMKNDGAFQCDTSVTTGTVNADIAIIPQVSSNGQLLLNYVGSNHSTANAACMLNYSKTFNGANVSQSGFTIYDSISQTGVSGMSDLIVYRTETTIGSGTQRMFSGQVGGVEKWGVDNRGGQIVGLTPDAIMQVGMIAMVDAGTDERYDINGAGGTLPIGVVSGSGPTAVGTARGLIVQGTCYVAPAEDVVAVTRGHVCFVDGSDAGYVDDNAALQAAGLNIGRYINTEAAIAFNGADDVDPDTDQIVLDSTPSWVVGDPVIFWDSGDTAPTGMTTGAVYWIKTISTATVTLSATRGGATLDITADGSGTTMYLMRLPKVILHWQ